MMSYHKRTMLLILVAVIAIVAAVMAQGKKTLDARTLAVGAVAPSFALPDQDGKTHALAQARGKVVLLAFYPADSTSGCTLEAHSLTSANKDLSAMGVVVYGVSVQDPKSHKQFCTQEGIPYTLLADTQKAASKAYGVLIPGVGVANRVTYIIGKDGKIVYVDKNVNSHLTTCGDDWVNWLKAHPEVAQNDDGRRINFAGGLILAARRNSPSVAKIGQTAPDFVLPDVTTGAQTSLTSLSQGKKATVVMFIATQCPYSNAYNERMVALAKEYDAKGITFAGINANSTESTQECAAHAKAHGFPFPVLKDAGNKVADAYVAHVTPETYVIDSKGVLVYHGRIDNDMDPANVKTHDLAAALDDTLGGRPVAKAQTKAFGCSIKRVRQ